MALLGLDRTDVDPTTVTMSQHQSLSLASELSADPLREAIEATQGLGGLSPTEVPPLPRRRRLRRLRPLSGRVTRSASSSRHGQTHPVERVQVLAVQDGGGSPLMEQPLPHEDAGLRYAVCEPADVPELIRMLALTFTESDPMPVAVGLDPDEFEALVALVVAPESTQGLTVVARDLASGVLAGASLNEDAATPPPDGLVTLSVKYGPIFELLGQLDDRSAHPPVTEPGAVLHLFLLGVDGRYAGRGIAQRLVQASLRHAAAMGYRRAIAEATNRTSQHIFRKAGFTTRAQVSYADFRRDGVAVFASISGHGGPAAMMREL